MKAENGMKSLDLMREAERVPWLANKNLWSKDKLPTIRGKSSKQHAQSKGVRENSVISLLRISPQRPYTKVSDSVKETEV